MGGNCLQKIKILPRSDTASTVSAAVSLRISSTAASIPSGSIGKFLEDAGGTAGSPSLAETSVVHPIELEATRLPFEVPTPEGPTSVASPLESSETTK